MSHHDDLHAGSADTTVAGDVALVTVTATMRQNSSGLDEDLDGELLFHNILYKVMVPVMFGLIIGVGVIGNALVVYVTLACSAMRTTVNLLLLNLAVSDVLFLVIAVPFIAYHYAADNWLIGDVALSLN